MAGLNQNVQHQGTLWHVQTELDGISQSVISTHIFFSGAVLVRKTAQLKPGLSPKEVSESVLKHHHTVIAALKAGRFDKELPITGDASAPPTDNIPEVEAPPPKQQAPAQPPPPKQQAPAQPPPPPKQQTPAPPPPPPKQQAPAPPPPAKQVVQPPAKQVAPPPPPPPPQATKPAQPARTAASQPQTAPIRQYPPPSASAQPSQQKPAAAAPVSPTSKPNSSSFAERVVSTCRAILEPEIGVIAFGVVEASNTMVFAAYPVHCDWKKSEVEVALSSAAEIFYVATRYGADSNWDMAAGNPDEVFLITRQCYEYVAPYMDGKVVVLLTKPALPKPTGRALLRRCLERLRSL